MSSTNLRISLNSSNPLRINMSQGASERIRLVNSAASSFSGKITIDTTAGWNQKIMYVPLKGEIVIYSDRNLVGETYYPGIKIGDGNAYVVDLPFFEDDVTDAIMEVLNNHINDTSIHVTPEEKTFWNEKLNYETEGENLIFTRN